MSKILVVGNWKMNPATISEAKILAKKIKAVAPRLQNTDAVMAPPLAFASACAPQKPVKNLYLGAQFVSVESGVGPFTGEVSVDMLKSLNIQYIILGHSEQRARGETSAMVSKKMKNALEAGITPVLCVGEMNRDQDGSYLEPLKAQIKESLEGIPKKYAKEIVIAYEPVWAIGAKEAMMPDQIYETSLFVKKVFADIFTPDAGVKATILYGGSVNFRNAADIISIGKVDGFLVGRESVNAAGFVELLKTVDSVV